MQEHTEINPPLPLKITTALAGNLPVSDNMIQALGQECAGFTTTQILGAPPNVLMSSLGTLSTVNGWDQGQATTIIQVLLQKIQVLLHMYLFLFPYDTSHVSP